MTVFQIILSTCAVLQVCLLAIVSSTLIDIKTRLAAVGEGEAMSPGGS